MKDSETNLSRKIIKSGVNLLLLVTTACSLKGYSHPNPLNPDGSPRETAPQNNTQSNPSFLPNTAPGSQPPLREDGSPSIVLDKNGNPIPNPAPLYEGNNLMQNYTPIDLPRLNDYGYIMEVIPADDPAQKGRNCSKPGDIKIETNEDAFIIINKMEGNKYGPDSFVIYRAGAQIATVDTRTQPIPSVAIGIPHREVTVCKQ
jgi:hypothetical protein